MSNEMKYDVIVIGAGASGLFSAICAQNTEHPLSICILEKMDTPGKKLLITGDGRCNYTNDCMNTSFYHTDDKDALDGILKNYSVNTTRTFFQNLGLRDVERNGYRYPKSNQSKTILNLLLNECHRLGIQMKFQENVRRITREQNLFQVKTEQNLYEAKAVILATGGKSYPKTGSSGDGYYYAKLLGHGIIPTYPSLVGLKLGDSYSKELFGVRETASISCHLKGQSYQSSGEIQFTKEGISGLAVFELSGPIIRAMEEEHIIPRVQIDLLPEESEQDTYSILKDRWEKISDSKCNVASLFEGMFTDKMLNYLCDLTSIHLLESIRTIEEKELSSFCHACHNLTFEVIGNMDYQKAQVTSGGIPLSEIDPNNMESKFTPGFFLAGEIINVDGICGGYNLQFAWSSGALAGKGAKEYIRKTHA